jgi:hypothetical protein
MNSGRIRRPIPLGGDTQRGATREAPAQTELRPTRLGLARRLAAIPNATDEGPAVYRLPRPDSSRNSIPSAV